MKTTVTSFLNASGQISLLEAAQGCRAAGFDPVECAPVLYTAYPTTDANTLGSVLVQAWMGITTPAIVNAGLTGCKTGAGASAYTPAQIQASVQANISLIWANNAILSGNDTIALFQGDLTHMKQAEAVNYLVISALPNDYSPVPGSMIAALAAIGVNVGQLAQNKAADYRSTDYSWISQPITGQAFGRIVCFEPPNSGQAAADVPGIFNAVKTFAGPSATYVTIASAMVSTGSGGANINDILTALFNGSKSLIASGFNLTCSSIVVYNQSWMSGLQTLFNQLKA
jgi:hypothetical protein